MRDSTTHFLSWEEGRWLPRLKDGDVPGNKMQQCLILKGCRVPTAAYKTKWKEREERPLFPSSVTGYN